MKYRFFEQPSHVRARSLSVIRSIVESFFHNDEDMLMIGSYVINSIADYDGVRLRNSIKLLQKYERHSSSKQERYILNELLDMCSWCYGRIEKMALLIGAIINERFICSEQTEIIANLALRLYSESIFPDDEIKTSSMLSNLKRIKEIKQEGKIRFSAKESSLLDEIHGHFSLKVKQ